MPKRKGRDDEQGRERCPMAVAMEVIGGKWKQSILFHLLGGTKRFGELQRALPGRITQQMLTLQLRELERDGLVHREVYRQVPPRTEYSLTPVGRELEPILWSLRAWGETYLNHRAFPASHEDERPIVLDA